MGEGSGLGPGLYLVEALIPQEAPGEEGAAGHSTEQPCFLTWKSLVWQSDQGGTVEVANAAQQVAQGSFCHCLNP